MSLDELQQLEADATRIYDLRLRDQLETSHPHAFVEIEPESGDYFLGKTLSEAMGAAHIAHPTLRAFCLRVGHSCAIQIGGHLA